MSFLSCIVFPALELRASKTTKEVTRVERFPVNQGAIKSQVPSQARTEVASRAIMQRKQSRQRVLNDEAPQKLLVSDFTNPRLQIVVFTMFPSNTAGIEYDCPRPSRAPRHRPINFHLLDQRGLVRGLPLT